MRTCLSFIWIVYLLLEDVGSQRSLACSTGTAQSSIVCYLKKVLMLNNYKGGWVGAINVKSPRESLPITPPIMLVVSAESNYARHSVFQSFISDLDLITKLLFLFIYCVCVSSIVCYHFTLYTFVIGYKSKSL